LIAAEKNVRKKEHKNCVKIAFGIWFGRESSFICTSNPVRRIFNFISNETSVKIRFSFVFWVRCLNWEEEEGQSIHLRPKSKEKGQNGFLNLHMQITQLGENDWEAIFGQLIACTNRQKSVCD
jgi:hypothetical protein